ncbi:HAD-IB family hydrolase [Sphingomonas donggukensis]|uniref:HAD-IB family hydrolase n=1 Tax=Sphingomonas donggukensis TaxID=2949093 RepID=A0ABY4TSM7_9SPHN|nr:HAD-IB family hydrolase [Sphingomonas donggukensis]URW75318.1 HAD-IB family hydrolase [Sphingomonas donggukensis]
MMPTRIAIYDMDKTITRTPTWTPFLAFAMRRRARWRLALLPWAALAGTAYVLKLIDRARLKQTTQKWLLGGSLAADHVASVTAAFADHIVATGVLDAARARIAADRADGCRLVMATASYAFYARAIAERLGFDDVIATESEHDPAGALTHRIAGENVYGAAKLRAVKAWMAQQRLDRGDAHIRFYSDHVSDAPVMEWADEAFAVNAHGPLKTLARRRGWPILDWRGDA